MLKTALYVYLLFGKNLLKTLLFIGLADKKAQYQYRRWYLLKV